MLEDEASIVPQILDEHVCATPFLTPKHANILASSRLHDGCRMFSRARMGVVLEWNDADAHE
jgi:hypothetical protein